MNCGIDSCHEYSIDMKAVAETKKCLPKESTLVLLARQYQALAEPNRLKILLSLRQRELCVCELGEVLNMSAPAVSHHLRRLKDLGLIKSRRSGKLAYYSLDDEHIVSLLDAGLTHVKHRF